MIGQLLVSLGPVTSAAVLLGLILMLTACAFMVREPVAWMPAPAALVPVWTVEEWTYQDGTTLRRVRIAWKESAR